LRQYSVVSAAGVSVRRIHARSADFYQ
jgi:hypothetical protein